MCGKTIREGVLETTSFVPDQYGHFYVPFFNGAISIRMVWPFQSTSTALALYGGSY